MKALSEPTWLTGQIREMLSAAEKRSGLKRAELKRRAIVKGLPLVVAECATERHYLDPAPLTAAERAQLDARLDETRDEEAAWLAQLRKDGQ